MVAGTNVLGAGFVLIAGWRPLGTALWFLGVALLGWALTLVGMGRFLLRPAPRSVLRRAAS
jgi:hypothetical protein